MPPSTTAAKVAIRMGSWKGMASHPSFPSSSVLKSMSQTSAEMEKGLRRVPASPGTGPMRGAAARKQTGLQRCVHRIQRREGGIVDGADGADVDTFAHAFQAEAGAGGGVQLGKIDGAGQAEAALPVDSHDVAHAHAVGLHATVQDGVVQAVGHAAVVAYRLALAGGFQLQACCAAELVAALPG